jgi:DNA-binding protein Fis
MLPDIAIPALIALIFKLILLAYSARFPSKSLITRWFVGLLLVLALHNLAEVLLLYHFVHYGITAVMAAYGYGYIGFLILAIALILDISLRLSFDPQPDGMREKLRPLLYVPAAALLFLLLFTDHLVVGFQPFKNTVLRIAGPWYFSFETYLIVYFQMALVYLMYGARNTRTSAIRRTRSRLWLIGIAPVVLLLDYLIIANHFGVARISSTIYLPVALTFFLVVTTYATHEYRLFDIEFYIPWSTVRQRKTAFYARIQATVAELADLASVDQALERVSGLLHCSVALVGGPRPVLATAGSEGLQIAQFPHDMLENVNHIVVAREIAQTMPQTHQMMQQFGVAAIVPFHPNSKTAASWMLLGDAFSNSVYTPLDFKMVEKLFDGLGEFFLDKLAFLRAELASAKSETDGLKERLAGLDIRLNQMQEEVALVREQNYKLLRENQVLRNISDLHRTQVKKGQVVRLAPKADTDWSKTFDEQVSKLEVQLIRQALAQCGGSKSEAARLLGLRPNTLHYKMEKHGITVEPPGGKEPGE